MDMPYQVSPSRDEQSDARRLFIFLKGRRALFSSTLVEQEEHIIQSVYRIRKHLAEDFDKVNAKSVLGECREAMRVACRKFCKEVRQTHTKGSFTPSFLFSLYELRHLFGDQIARIAGAYHLEIDEDLKRLVHQRTV